MFLKHCLGPMFLHMYAFSSHMRYYVLQGHTETRTEFHGTFGLRAGTSVDCSNIGYFVVMVKFQSYPLICVAQVPRIMNPHISLCFGVWWDKTRPRWYFSVNVTFATTALIHIMTLLPKICHHIKELERKSRLRIYEMDVHMTWTNWTPLQGILFFCNIFR